MNRNTAVRNASACARYDESVEAAEGGGGEGMFRQDLARKPGSLWTENRNYYSTRHACTRAAREAARAEATAEEAEGGGVAAPAAIDEAIRKNMAAKVY